VQLAEMEIAEEFDPSGLERVELAIAQLTSVVTAFGGGFRPPDEIARDWGGVRARSTAERAETVDLLAMAKERAGVE